MRVAVMGPASNSTLFTRSSSAISPAWAAAADGEPPQRLAELDPALGARPAAELHDRAHRGTEASASHPDTTEAAYALRDLAVAGRRVRDGRYPLEA
jgi:hypothetical protein